MVLICVVYTVCLWLHVSPIRSGITGGFSPRELVTGLTVNLLRHCQFNVGTYIEGSTNAIITNDNYDRTHPYIYLGPSGKITRFTQLFFSQHRVCRSVEVGKADAVARQALNILTCGERGANMPSREGILHFLIKVARNVSGRMMIWPI